MKIYMYAEVEVVRNNGIKYIGTWKKVCSVQLKVVPDPGHKTRQPFIQISGWNEVADKYARLKEKDHCKIEGVCYAKAYKKQDGSWDARIQIDNATVVRESENGSRDEIYISDDAHDTKSIRTPREQYVRLPDGFVPNYDAVTPVEDVYEEEEDNGLPF